jgi:hypothetical protein
LKVAPFILVLACALAVAIGAQAASNATVIKLTAVQQSQKQTKTGFVLRDTDVIAGRTAGHDSLTCKVAGQKKATCKASFDLSDGTIEATVLILFAKPSGGGTITAGTGRYAGAKGKLAWRNLNDAGTRTAIVFTFT